MRYPIYVCFAFRTQLNRYGSLDPVVLAVREAAVHRVRDEAGSQVVLMQGSHVNSDVSFPGNDNHSLTVPT